MRIEAHWPLYTVLPGTAAFFYAAYFFVWDRLLRYMVHVYAKLSPLEQSCLRANCNSLVHTYSIVILLCWALASDPIEPMLPRDGSDDERGVSGIRMRRFSHEPLRAPFRTPSA